MDARDGIQCLVDRCFAGKMVIFPQVRSFPLTALADLKIVAPEVYNLLGPGEVWTCEAEAEFFAPLHWRSLPMKEAVIFGAGAVGRGFLGQLYSESGYRVTFADVDQALLDALNRRGEVYHSPGDQR